MVEEFHTEPVELRISDIGFEDPKHYLLFATEIFYYKDGGKDIPAEYWPLTFIAYDGEKEKARMNISMSLSPNFYIT